MAWAKSRLGGCCQIICSEWWLYRFLKRKACDILGGSGIILDYTSAQGLQAEGHPILSIPEHHRPNGIFGHSGMARFAGCQGCVHMSIAFNVEKAMPRRFSMLGTSGDAFIVFSSFSSNAHEILQGMTAYFGYVYSEALFAKFSHAKYDESNGA